MVNLKEAKQKEEKKQTEFGLAMSRAKRWDQMNGIIILHIKKPSTHATQTKKKRKKPETFHFSHSFLFSISNLPQMCDYDWVNLAMANDSIVANLLLHFNNPPPPPSLQLHWTIRQPRSRSIPKSESSIRASPTTPLTCSWSATTSASEESNLPTKLITKTSSRSKVRSLL